jgi:TolB-like protein/DNA-binding winged helix-turn-helix (wHTH) protein/Tfp pilus assembly protein PilF
MTDESRVLRVGEWRVDPDLDELSRGEETIRVEPRTMRLLMRLAAHAGRVVDVQQLLEEVWPNVVVTHGSVYQAVAQLRQILGDDCEHPSYIENLPRRGYRLIAAVASWDTASQAATDPTLAAQGLTQMTIRSVGAGQQLASQGPVSAASTTPRAVGGETPREFHAHLGHNVGTWSAFEKSIAVLPFTNLSSDQENEYFGDGLAEEILNALSHIPELHVAARSSTFTFKNKGLNVSEIAERLRVATVLEGSVRRAADRLRITVQLVDAETGFHLWSERFDRRLSDIFEIQEEIAGAIAERLKVTLQSVDTRPTANVEAYELYLRGRYDLHQRSPTTLRAAIKSFEQSLKLDPNNARAFAGLADCYAILSYYGWMPTGEARRRAYEAMQRAVTLAPNLWETNYSRGLHIFTFDRAWRSAQPYFENAAAINPRAALVHTYFGMFLATAGQADKAIAQADLGRQLDPLSPFPHTYAAMTFAILGRLEAAESAARHAIELQPDFLPALFGLGGILCKIERSAEAVSYFERAVQLSRAPFYVGWLGYGVARAGRADDARRLLSELDERGSRGEFIPPLARLQINAGLGDIAAIRTAFAAAIELWTPPLPIRFGPDLQRFRTDPEVDRLYVELFGS